MWSAPAFQVLGPSYPFLIAAAILAVAGGLAFRVPIDRRAPEPVPAD